MKILVFDNYDSFTYNLVHLVEKITHQKVEVHRNDKIQMEEIRKYDKIILSPGPGIPEEAGLLLPLIKEYANEKSILGVCLGHQAIGQAFGAKLVNLSSVYHGVATPITIDRSDKDATLSADDKLFNGLPTVLEVGRYHSWVVAKDGFPADLDITAEDDSGYIMALQHKKYDVRGVQFHPESILTPMGEEIMRNWLKS
ncbi:MAG: aminodeoxychorismate/anthranilate synthase component II [Chitinophagaceae bacterium]|nr:aminodeoxychorismate/anthranilate synthase component II [Chitinophagaceae bacterium]